MPQIPKIKEFINNWDTRGGLFYNVYIFGIAFFVLSGLIQFGYLPFNVGKFFLIVPNIIFMLCWGGRRSYLGLYFSKKLNVVFSLGLQDKNNTTLTIYKDTINNLKSKILENNLEKSIIIKERPRDATFKTKDAAEAKTQLGLRGSVLLIWGEIIETTNIYKLFFSYEFGYPGREKDYYKRIFNKQIDKVLAGKLWSYKGPSSIEILSQNFLEVAYFIFGLTMATLGQFEKSLILLEGFINEWGKSNNLIKKRSLGPALNEAKRILAHIYRDYAELGRYQKNYDNVKIYAQKLLDINYDTISNYSAYLFLAIYYEEGLSDIETAKQTIKEAADIHPPRAALHRFSEAYFAFNDYDFELALGIYDELTRWDHNTSYNAIRRSLFEKYQKTKNLGFWFAEIYIASIFENDKIYGKEEFKKFITKAEKSKDTINYGSLIDRAEKYLIDFKNN